MIHFTLTGKQVKDFFGMVKEFNSECRLRIEPDKIRVSIVDCGNVALINTEIKVSTGTKDPLQFGLQIGNLLQFARIAKNTDPIEFKVITTKKSEPCLRVSCLTHSAKFKSQDVNVITKDPNQVKIPLPITFNVSGERIAEFFKIFTARTGALVIEVKNKQVVFRTHHEFDYEYETLVGSAPGEARSLFSSDYLRPIFLRMKKSMISVSMGTDHPVKLITEDNDVRTEVMVAPRIEAD